MSFNIGISGLNTANKKLETVSQNIANSETAGYKETRAEFAAVYAGGEPGGVEVSRVSQNFGRDGGKQFTGRDLDLAISGGGFFMTRSPSGETQYTRAGLFTKDAQNFITNADGQRLQGFGVNAAGALVTGAMTDIQLGTANIPANASTKLGFVANYKADAPVIPAAPPFDPTDSATFSYSYSSTLYDSLGSERTLTQYMVKDSPNNWTTHYLIDGNNIGSQAVVFNPDGTLNSPAAPVNLAYNPPGADPMSVDLDMAGTTQYAGNFAVTKNETDGYTAGDASGLRVDDDGKVYTLYSNGRDLLMGQVVLTNFANPEGMERVNGTAWKSTFASGAPLLGEPGTGNFGSLTSGAYEGSNVDLTSQLVDLVAGQRHYQANAKIISTANETNQILMQSV